MKKWKIPDHNFQCSVCRGFFKKGWSDEEAYALAERKFGSVPKEELSVVCDDCYQKLMPPVSD